VKRLSEEKLFERLKLLAQAWKQQEPEIEDYACNVHAEEIAHWHIVRYLAKEKGELDEEVEKGCEIIIQILKKRGTAKWFKEKADILTELASRSPLFRRAIKSVLENE